MDIVYTGFGTIVVDGTRYDHDVVVEDGRVRPRDKGPSRRPGPGHTPLSAQEAIPWSRSRLVIGTGYSGRLPVLPEVEKEARRRGVDLVAVPTVEAAALLAGDPDANGILHVTC